MNDGSAQRDRIEPAAAALAPGDRAELMADARKMRAVLIEEFGGERSRAHARGVGLHDAEHIVEVSRADTGARCGETAGGIRRRDVRIGAMVDVEHCAL